MQYNTYISSYWFDDYDNPRFSCAKDGHFGIQNGAWSDFYCWDVHGNNEVVALWVKP
jgi:hypothetical protein